MRSSTFLLCLTAVAVVALLPAVTAAKDRFVTDVNATARRGEPGLEPNAACAPTDDPVQCAALVDLYNATNGDKWTTNTGWLSGSSYCGWNWLDGQGVKNGVRCDSSGNVASLYLGSNQLTGTIPSSLGFNLKSLQGLNLDRNKLTGTIPDSLSNLNSLEYLGLNYNQLTGTIPDSLGNLTSLTVLSLDNNQLTGTIPSSICPFVAASMRICQLSNNDFSCPLPCGTARYHNGCSATCT